MDDRPRKDRLIQTRVPQDLESTLKDEARKRRLSVSHLIRNVLEDTFSLVDNVVSEVDRVVHDSVGVAQALKRDARRLAATARGETAHREKGSSPMADAAGRAVEAARGTVAAEPVGATKDLDRDEAASPIADERPGGSPEVEGGAAEGGLRSGPLAAVYGFQELVLNRPANCANCGAVIARGARAYLGMSDESDGPRVWVCQRCLDTISD
jgi:hypothetical protein